MCGETEERQLKSVTELYCVYAPQYELRQNTRESDHPFPADSSLLFCLLSTFFRNSELIPLCIRPKENMVIGVSVQKRPRATAVLMQQMSQALKKAIVVESKDKLKRNCKCTSEGVK